MRERIRMAAERLVPLEGTLNFRDLGGYVALDGRTVKWGLVFRSDALHELTDNDRARLREMGLRVVYDLRRAVEREKQPTALSVEHGHRLVHLAVDEDPDAAANQPEIIDLILSGELPEADDSYMADLYAQILLNGAQVFGRLLTHLTEDDGLPALFHCAAGKDRTGLAAALLLSVLGVDDEAILEDYELTNIYRSNRRIEVLRPTLEAAGVDVEKVRPFLSARRPVMEATLRHLHTDHGGVESYLLGPAGMSTGTLSRLRDLLLE
jgi:protein-tyrosine phosphatase